MLSRFKFLPSVVVSAALCSTALYAQVEGPVTTRVVVRADVKGDAAPDLQASTIRVNVAGRDVPVVRVAPLVSTPVLRGGGAAQPTEVAILLDEGLRSNFDINLKEITGFVRNLASPTTSVGVGYMRNGTVVFSKGFSNDPDTVAKSVRIPMSNPGISASPYFCVQDLAKHWPTQTGAARVVLMITNGIDYYNGSVSPLNQNSPYVDDAIRDLQRASIPVYSIYFGGRGVNGFYSSASGQNYLSEVAEGTGGEMYNQGQITPPSILPYLKDFQQALSHSYVVEFQDSGKNLERLKVSTSTPDVKLRAQKEVQAARVGSDSASSGR